MKVVVTAQGKDLDSPTSPIFGRCPVFAIVDSDTMAIETFDNASAAAGGGAGIQAAQWVVDQGAEAVLSLNVGPNAFAVLVQAGVAVYRIEGGTVREVVQALNEGRLEALSRPNVASHSGMSRRGGF
ncbi:MAG: dinitrogenase iron-molybdenum cofactor biosynthesis protein [Anaerolineae bacterium]|nr:dinitrogenase iron-molybdenum cofactor biosynthesis protein [Anaerolineae bacterium]